MLSWYIIRFCILRQRHIDHLSNNNCWRREQWKYIFRLFCQSQSSYKKFFPVEGSTHGYTFLQSHILIIIPLVTCEVENVNSLLSSGMKKNNFMKKNFKFLSFGFQKWYKMHEKCPWKTWKIALKSVKMDVLKIWKKRLGVLSLGTLCPKISFLS